MDSMGSGVFKNLDASMTLVRLLKRYGVWLAMGSGSLDREVVLLVEEMGEEVVSGVGRLTFRKADTRGALLLGLVAIWVTLDRPVLINKY